MALVFWLSMALVFYTYLGYPFILKLLTFFKQMPSIKKADETPSVSIVIPAYNEENAIAKKIQNVLSLEYPVMKLEIVVVSDCSSDQTEEIVQRYSSKGVRLFCMSERGGKIAGYKAVLPTLTGEIIVFSDATSRLAFNSLRQLVRGFADPRVGCVAGRLVYHDPNKADIARGEMAYWSYESLIKQWEEAIFSLTSVSGTFYAVRREFFPLMMADDLADDLIVVLNTVKNGKRVIMEPQAICQEHAIHADDAEVSKRWRITIQNLRGLFSMPEMLNPFQYGQYAWMLISHKLCRVLIPVFLLMILIANIFLTDQSIFFKSALIAQISFYFTGVLGFLWHGGRPKLVNVIYYFCVTNLAILLGIIKFFKGEKVAVWETAR